MIGVAEWGGVQKEREKCESPPFSHTNYYYEETTMYNYNVDSKNVDYDNPD